MKKFPLIALLAYVFGMTMLLSCNPEAEDVEPVIVEDAVKKAIFNSMKEWYYWNTSLPARIDPASYATNQELLDDLREKPLDRWSYLTTPAQFAAAFTGQASGVHGFGFGFNGEDKLFVTFVFNQGPAGQDGWQRGWEFVEINGKPINSYRNANGSYSFDLGPNTIGITNTFTFKLPDGTLSTRTIQKGAFQANSVLNRSTFDVGDKKVGYWAYQSFRATAGLQPTRSQEVEDSFEFFQSQGIDELIIDLRYNGGGSVAVTEQILNYVVPSAANGREMYTNRHNPSKSIQNRSVNFNKKGNLSFSRIIFITSRGSASASELLINCLTPYLDVVLIGDRTYGKPVGSFPLSSFNRVLSTNDLELVPITFAIANAQGSADYFEGFPVNYEIGDDPTRNWGDVEEKRLKAALEFIESGAVSRRADVFYKPVWEMIDAFEGLEKEFPLY